MVSWCSGTGVECYKDYIQFIFEDILVSYGDDEMELEGDSLLEREVLVGGEEGCDRRWGHFKYVNKCL